MPIQYVGGRTAGFVGRTSSIDVSLGSLTGGDTGDTTPQAGDLVVVGYAVGSTVDRALTINTPAAGGGAAYTLMGTELTASDTFDANLRVAYKFMGGTPDTTVTLGQTGSLSDAGRYTIQVFRGVDPSTPLDVAVTTATGTSSSAVNPAAIQPITAGAWIGVVGMAASGTGRTMTASDLTDVIAGSQADTNDASILAGIKIDWSSGSFNPATFGNIPSGTTANSWAAVSYALRPAADQPVTHATSGALAGQGGAVAGAASSATARASSGVLSTAGAVVAGAAARTRVHQVTGVLIGQAGAIVGASARTRVHAVDGVLAGAGAAFAGDAAREGAPVTHAASGELAAAGAVLDGTAARERLHAASGEIAGQGAEIAAASARTRQHAAIAALAGQGALAEGSAGRVGMPVTHATSGALAGSGAAMSGVAARPSDIQVETNVGSQAAWVARAEVGMRRAGRRRMKRLLEEQAAAQAKLAMQRKQILDTLLLAA